MMMALLLAAAFQTSAAPASTPTPMELGAEWAKGKISQKCLDEVAAMTKEKADTDKNRRLARLKAQDIAGRVAMLAEAYDEKVRSAAWTADPKDDETVKNHAVLMVYFLKNVPSCNVDRLHANSAVVKQARSVLPK